MSKLLQDNGLFKHTHVFTGYVEGTPYLHYKDGTGVVDGIGRMHINLYKECDTCGKQVLVAMIHVDKDGKLYKTKKSEPKLIHPTPVIYTEEEARAIARQAWIYSIGVVKFDDWWNEHKKK